MKPQERIRAILRSGLEPADRLVLVALSTYLSDDDYGWAWPSALTLGTLTGLSERHVRRVLEGLQLIGLIERQGQCRRRIRWSAIPDTMSGFCVGKTDTMSDSEEPKTDTMSGLSAPPKTDTMSATRTPCPDQNGHHVRRSDHDPSKDPTRERTRASRATGAAPPDPASLSRATRLIEGITTCPAASSTVVPKPIRAFFEAQAGCDPDALVEAALLVATAAREAPGTPWADELRGEGWDGKRDWSRKVSSILDLSKWSERLALARAWDAAGRPKGHNGHAAPEVRPAALHDEDRLMRVQTALEEAGLDAVRAGDWATRHVLQGRPLPAEYAACGGGA